jgi:predicted dehydrogenase
MVDAARKHQRVFQVGTQRRSSLKHRVACRLVREGRIGRVQTVVCPNYPSPWECKFPEQPVPEGLDWNTWCGQTEPVPYHADIYIQRSNPGWISVRPYSGGEMTGTGAHGIDLIQWALGTDHTGPVEVRPEGGKLEPLTYLAPESRSRGNAHTSQGRAVTFRYAEGTTLKLAGGPLGGLFTGRSGKISIDGGTVSSDPPEIVQEALKAAGDQRQPGHLENWLDCVRSREKPAADVEIGHRATVICHLGNIARWTGRTLRWDAAKETFPGDDEANAYLERPMRKPYELPAAL